jgi:hypothetical protein
MVDGKNHYPDMGQAEMGRDKGIFLASCFGERLKIEETFQP